MSRGHLFARQIHKEPKQKTGPMNVCVQDEGEFRKPPGCIIARAVAREAGPTHSLLLKWGFAQDSGSSLDCYRKSIFTKSRKTHAKLKL
jgi:hypothetical protein